MRVKYTVYTLGSLLLSGVFAAIAYTLRESTAKSTIMLTACLVTGSLSVKNLWKLHLEMNKNEKRN